VTARRTSAPLAQLPGLCLDPELEEAARFLADTPPPAEPVVLQRNRYGAPLITVDCPRFWEYARAQLAEGVRAQHARGLLLFLRRLKEVLTP